jgi:hypothetical protein
MKSFLALIIYGLLGCSLSISQASLYQESKLILHSLKQLDLQQLTEVTVAEQAVDPDEIKCAAEEAQLLPQYTERALMADMTETETKTPAENATQPDCMPFKNNELLPKQRPNQSKTTANTN